ncbi:MAG: hypothetical protein KDE55_19115 [Novosphingobium sp.]|nr:hypothetical protein [Novosphingobium sp.]
MSINQSIFIQGSVGNGGRNNPADVRAVQNQLNGLMSPPRVRLTVDGQSGPKTCAMIADFQINVVRLRRADSRVDPNGRTLQALNDPTSEGTWVRMSLAPNTPAGPQAGALTPNDQQKYQRLVSAAGPRPELKPAVDFLSYLAENEVATLKLLLNVQNAAQYPVEVMQGLAAMRRAGFTARELAMMFADASKAGAGRFDNALDAMRLVGKGGRIAATLKSIGNVANVLQILATAVVAIDHFKAGRYGPGFAEIYGTGMGMAIPWAGFVNAVQELLFEANPAFAGNPKARAAFQFLLACEPIGAGKTAIDTIATFLEMGVTAIFTGKVPPNAVDQLVARMRNSPMRFWTEIGDSLGDWMGDKFGLWYYETFLR